jgi:hypothetical protein
MVKDLHNAIIDKENLAPDGLQLVIINPYVDRWDLTLARIIFPFSVRISVVIRIILETVRDKANKNAMQGSHVCGIGALNVETLVSAKYRVPNTFPSVLKPEFVASQRRTNL